MGPFEVHGRYPFVPLGNLVGVHIETLLYLHGVRTGDPRTLPSPAALVRRYGLTTDSDWGLVAKSKCTVDVTGARSWEPRIPFSLE